MPPCNFLTGHCCLNPPFTPQVQGLRISAKFAGNPGASIPLACGTPDRLKAAYRFFDNDKVSELEMLEPHGQANKNRMAGQAVVYGHRKQDQLKEFWP